MNRIAKQDIQCRIDIINNIFERHGKNTQWSQQGRNGYQAIDAGPADGYPGENVCAGFSKRELYDALGLALEALSVLGKEPMPNIEERKKTEQERMDAIKRWNERIKKYSANLEEAGIDIYSI